MGLYLVTGQPGHGKTAFALDKAFKLQKEGRTIYAHGIKDMDYEKAGFKYIEDPTKWEELPDGSVLLLDECYGTFPNRNPGAKVPPHVDAMARHRHRGFDFILIAQQGLQLDPFLRGLYEEHVHVRQTSIFKSKCKLKRWNEYQGNVKGHCADIQDWIRPAYVFDFYTSTTMNTTTRRLPMWARYLIGAVIFLLCVAWFVKHRINARMDSYAKPTTEVTADATDAFGRRPSVSGASDKVTYASATDYAKAHLPRFGTMPWTAPIYDQRGIATDPQIICASSLGGQGADGTYMEPSCTCLTEQGTLYELSQAECRTVARRGPIYNPYKAQRENQPPPAVMPQAVAAASSPVTGVVSNGSPASEQFPLSPGYTPGSSGPSQQ